MKIHLGLALIALGGAAACGGAAATRETVEEPAVEPDEAVQQARDVVGEVHASIKRGSPEGMLPVVAEDVFVAGARGADVFLDRSAVIVALTEALGQQRAEKHKVSARKLEIGSALGGHSAWATESVVVDGTSYTATAVLSDVDDIWVVSAVHVAEPVPDRKRSGAVSPPPAPADVAAGAGEAVDLLRQAAADPEPRAALLDQLADSPATTWIDGDGSITRGTKKIAKAWKKATKKKKPTFTLTGDVRAGVSADGELAWVLAGVAIGNNKHAPVPGRLFYVYRKDPGSDVGWRLVVAHEAVLTK